MKLSIVLPAVCWITCVPVPRRGMIPDDRAENR